MRDGLLHPVHDAHRDDSVEEFGAPVGLARGPYARIDGLYAVIAAYFAAGIEQRVDQGRKMTRRRLAIDEQRLGSAADAGAPQLGVQHDGHRHRQVRCTIDVDVAIAIEVTDHRHPSLLLHAGDEALATARDEYIDELGHAGF